MFAEKFGGVSGGGESSSVVAKPYLVEEPLSSHDISKSLGTPSEMVMSEFEDTRWSKVAKITHSISLHAICSISLRMFNG